MTAPRLIATCVPSSPPPLLQVEAELDRYGLTELFGQDAIYPTLSGAVAAFRAATDTGTGTTRTDAPEDTPPP